MSFSIKTNEVNAYTLEKSITEVIKYIEIMYFI